MVKSRQIDFRLQVDLELNTELRTSALALLVETDPVSKAFQTQRLFAEFKKGSVGLDVTQNLLPAIRKLSVPGRPDRPLLVSPIGVKKRSMRTIEGRAALIHAIAHIEFNAINLALDAIWRFANMPATYYADWLKVASEEAYHFTLLTHHLQTLGFNYGDFVAHNSLWEMVDRTKSDVLARMALVPRTMEARGLDANPALRNKLAQADDSKAAEILDIILRDEIGHVLIGNYWFNWLCEQQGLAPLTTYARLASQYAAPKLRPPFNTAARLQAGFTEAELLAMTAT